MCRSFSTCNQGRLFSRFLLYIFFVFSINFNNSFASYLGTTDNTQTLIKDGVGLDANASDESMQGDPKNQTENLYLTLQPYIVSIEIRTTLAGYSDSGTSYGTGAIFDKENGYIVTNAHVATPDGVIDHYDITLHDGTVIQAQLFYVDPWHDFAILKADPNKLKQIPSAIPTKRNSVYIGESVIIIGKNENNHFSAQTGTVASAFETSDVLSGQVFRISLNAQGGASGSPVFNEQGKVIGILYASNDLTSAFAIPVDYVLDAIEHLKSGKKPPRYGTGAIINFTPLEELVRYDSFPAEKAEEIKQAFPMAFSRVLSVKTTLKGSPAESVFQPGDVLIAINGTPIGPSLYDLDKITNIQGEKGTPTVTFDIIRHGKNIQQQAGLYDLNTYKLKRLLHFGKAVFYEVDDEIVRRTGATRGVFVTNRKPGGGFHSQIPGVARSGGSGTSSLVAITNVDGHVIKNLDDFVKLLPSLMKKKDFYIKIINYGAEFGYNSELYFTQNEQLRYIPYRATDGLPELFTFNESTHVWDVKIIQP